MAFQSCGRLLRAGSLRLDVFDGVADRAHLLGILIGNLDPELFLERHDQLDGVERVSTQVFDERGRVGDLLQLDAELLSNDRPNPIRHSLRHPSLPWFPP